MRSLLMAVVLTLVVAGSQPHQAQAQLYYGYPSYGYGVMPSTTYAPGVYSPGLYAAPLTYYQPPYLWSSRYYVNPYTRGWYNERYYPLTNQYYYQYRTYPHW